MKECFYMINKFLYKVLNEKIDYQFIQPKRLIDENTKQLVLPNLCKSFIFENKEYKRLFVMGDLHGKYDKAIDVLRQVDIQDDDLLIMLGDYTDRGKQNIKCENLMLQLFKQDNVRCLMANHEFMLIEHMMIMTHRVTKKVLRLKELDTLTDEQWDIIIDYMKDLTYDGDIYHFNGGTATLDEVNESNIELFKQYLKTIVKLPKKIRLTVGDQEYFIVHAGIDPKVNLSEQNINDLLWIRESFYNQYDGDAIIVIGHTPVQSIFDDNIPHFRNNIIFNDTGSFILLLLKYYLEIIGKVLMYKKG